MSLSTSECSGKRQAPSVPTPGLADDNAKVLCFPCGPRVSAPLFQTRLWCLVRQGPAVGLAPPACQTPRLSMFVLLPFIFLINWMQTDT